MKLFHSNGFRQSLSVRKLKEKGFLLSTFQIDFGSSLCHISFEMKTIFQSYISFFSFKNFLKTVLLPCITLLVVLLSFFMSNFNMFKSSKYHMYHQHTVIATVLNCFWFLLLLYSTSFYFTFSNSSSIYSLIFDFCFNESFHCTL